MPGVDACNRNALGLCLVAEKAQELGKRPGVYTSLPLTCAVGDTLADIGQVLQHEGTARRSRLDNPLGEHMIMVTTLPKQFARKVLQVPFSRLGAMLLQLATKTEETPLLLFPSSISQEVTIGGHSRTVQPKINANGLMIFLNDWLRDTHHNMQAVATLAIAQISTAWRAGEIGERILRNGNGQLYPSCGGRNAESPARPFGPVGTGIITDRTHGTVRSLDRLVRRDGLTALLCPGYPLGIGLVVLLAPRQRTLDALRGLDASGTQQLSRQIRILSTQRIVGALMQFHPIAALDRKALLGNGIVTSRVLLKRALQYTSLLWCGMQWHNNRSIHAKSISSRPCVVNLVGRKERQGVLARAAIPFRG